MIGFFLRLIRYLNNKGWYLCHVYYDPPFTGGRKYLTWKDIDGNYG